MTCTEEIAIGEDVGRGIVTIASGALVVAGKPVALSYDDGRGSIGQLLARTAFERAEIEQRVRAIRHFVEHGIPPYMGLRDVIAPIEPLFAPGRYLVSFPAECGGAWDLLDFNTESGPAEFYPYGMTLIATEARARLDPQRVEYWAASIARRERPIVIAVRAVEARSFHFILDGHHKAEAYRRAGVHPDVLAIEAVEAPELSEEQRRAVLGPGVQSRAKRA